MGPDHCSGAGFPGCGHKGTGLLDCSDSGDLYHRSAWHFIVSNHPERLFCVALILECCSHHEWPVDFQDQRHQQRRDQQDVHIAEAAHVGAAAGGSAVNGLDAVALALEDVAQPFDAPCVVAALFRLLYWASERSQY